MQRQFIYLTSQEVNTLIFYYERRDYWGTSYRLYNAMAFNQASFGQRKSIEQRADYEGEWDGFRVVYSRS